MPYRLPRKVTDQDLYRADLIDSYQRTRRVGGAEPGAVAAPSTVEQLKDLAELHKAGNLSDEEFAAAKQRILGEPGSPA